MTKGSKQCFEMKESEYTTDQHSWGAAKSALEGNLYVQMHILRKRETERERDSQDTGRKEGRKES